MKLVKLNLDHFTRGKDEIPDGCFVRTDDRWEIAQTESFGRELPFEAWSAICAVDAALNSMMII